MFRSFKAKLLGLIVAILLATAAPILYHTWTDFRQEMVGQEEKSVRNVLRLVDLSIRNEYASLQFYESQALAMRKQQLRNVMTVVFEGFNKFYRMAEAKTLSTKDAQQAALTWSRSIRYGPDKDYFYVYDMDLVAISHPNPDIQGRDMSQHKDKSGAYSLQKTRNIVTTQPDNEGFKTFYWTRLGSATEVRKIAFVKRYPKWDWIVGTGVYIDDIDREVARKRKRMEEKLADSFRNVRIGKTGCVFLFTEANELVVPPSSSMGEIGHATNPATGHPLLTDLKQAAQTPDRAFAFPAPGTGPRGRRLLAYVRPFPEMDWYVATLVYADEINAPARTLVARQVLYLGAAILLGILLGLLIVNRIAAPLQRLAGYSEQLVESDFAGSTDIESGLLAIAQQSRDEVGHLAGAFQRMIEALKRYIRQLRVTTAAKERIESELSIAREIQMGILPKIFPAFPDRDEFDLHALIQPAKEVGGDFYDFFFIDDDRLCFAIGDVSGKGVPASLFMAVTKTLIKAVAPECASPGELLARVNNELEPDNDSAMFVTIFCGVLNVKTGDLAYASAGHNPPFLYRKENGGLEMLEADGIALGVMPGAEMEDRTLRLAPGDTLLLYTDGITEGVNPADEEFGEDRLQRMLLAHPEQPVKPFIESVRDAVMSFAGERPQFDDMTIVALRMRQNGETNAAPVSVVATAEPPPDPEGLSLRIRNRHDELPGVGEFIARAGERLGLPEDGIFEMQTAVDEAVTNLIQHAYPEGEEGVIDLACRRSDTGFVVEIRNYGQPFDPTEAEAPDVESDLDDREAGGLGIYFMKELTNELHYTYGGGVETITMIKYIPSA